MPDTEITKEWLQQPATKLVMRKLQRAANAAQAKYDTAKSHEEFIRLQQFRAVVQVEIPRIIERMVNEDEEPNKWRFWQWLRS